MDILHKKCKEKNSIEVLLDWHNLSTEIKFYLIDDAHKVLDNLSQDERDMELVWVIDKLEPSPI